LKVSSSARELDLSPRPRKRARGALPGTNDNNNKSSSSNNNNNNNNSDPSYIQWNHQKDLWEMQTAFATFRRGDQTVELHAQQHYGDEAYFRYWNSGEAFGERHDRVLFELLVGDDLLEDGRGGFRRVARSIAASPGDRRFGRDLGLECQASVIDYTNHEWVHADLSREEFTARLAANNQNNNDNNNNNGNGDTTTPLWKLASPESSSTAAEAVAALVVGPPTLDYSNKNARKRRLFTNLFLPGGSLAFALRAILWMTVPAPELSIVLLDWSSLLKGGSSKWSNSKFPKPSKPNNPSALSELALPILKSLVGFDIGQMRRFLFGQVVLSSKSSNNNNNDPSSSWSLLVIDRNDHALGVLERTLGEESVGSVALLYGSSHCPDLHAKLLKTGFEHTETEWRTAWSVQESNGGSGAAAVTGGAAAARGEDDGTRGGRGVPPAQLGVFLVVYLIVGALDWVGIVGDTASLLLDSSYLDALAEAALYLARHVLLYLGLSKFLIDWTNADQ